MCSIQSAPPKPPTLEGMVPDDAVEALAGSLGKKEADPGDGKPVEDKVKEKAKEEDREKLGEKEETIPPDYRLEEVKDKDGKPLLPKVPKESLLPMSEDFLLMLCPRTLLVPQTLHLLNLKRLTFLLSSLKWFPKPQLQPRTLLVYPLILCKVTTKNWTMLWTNFLTVWDKGSLIQMRTSR